MRKTKINFTNSYFREDGSESVIALHIGNNNQGRREKFRAPEQKFRLGSWVSGATKSLDEQKKVRASADVRISARNKKKTSSRPQAVV